MNVLIHAPVIIKVLVSLGIILAVNKVLKNLSLSILFGTLALAFWSGQTLGTIPYIAWKRFWSIENGMLSVIIILVIWLSSQMAAAGIMNDLVHTIKARLSFKGALMVLPAVIGLLPMPGGALFSAPLVDDCDETGSIDPLLKTRINYWFRHIWEYTWPLYPGLILTSSISGLHIWQLFFLGLPMTILAVVFGYFFFIRKINVLSNIKKNAEYHFFTLISPIIVVIGVYMVILIFIPSFSRISKYLPMTTGLLVAMIFLQIMRPLNLSRWKTIIFAKKPFTMVLIVVLVRIYGAFIEAKLPGGTYLMDQMRIELNQTGIPLTLLILLIPFISGLTTGVSVGFVGASMPIVISLLGSNPSLFHLLSTVIMSFTFGFMGVMLSPVHVCLIVTTEYFKTNLVKSLAAIIFPAITMMIAVLVYAKILW